MFGRAASFSSSHSDAEAWAAAPCEQPFSGRVPLAGHPLLPPQALEGCLRAWQPDAKRRRVAEADAAASQAASQEAIDPCKLLSLACTVDDGPGSSLDEPEVAGSLFCIENSLEACSSLEPESDEFCVYQPPDPLSLGPQGCGEAATEGCGALNGCDGGGAAARARAVLADSQQPPPPLASDPDLQEMLSVLCDTEVQMQPSSTYLEHHGPCVSPVHFIDAVMRRTATSWLVEVAAEFGLHQETLFLATALLDRFLSTAKGVPRTQLQLVCVACMLVAAKHEEEMHPSVLDFTNIADNCFLPGDLLRMEAVVLDVLRFRINTPTAHTFLSMYKQALGLQPRTCALASYLAELGMLEYELLTFRPSHVASAAVLLAKLYTNDIQDLNHMPAVTNYSTDDLKPCMRKLLALQHAAQEATKFASPYHAVRDKYRTHAWFCVATAAPFHRLPSVLLNSPEPAVRAGKEVQAGAATADAAASARSRA